MNELFLKTINMSISASWLILAILIFRFVLKKAPKWTHVLLWSIAGIRLLCPYSIESALSLIPSRQTIPDQILYGPNFKVRTGITPVDHQVNKYLSDHYSQDISVAAGHGNHVITILAIIWITGIAVLCSCTAVSCWNLHKRLRMAVKFTENIFEMEALETPFISGILRPRIIVPFKMSTRNFEYVIAHEQAHIQRRDHWWKPVGFAILTIYWFHPLIWLSYILFCRDIEFACDEKVIRKLESGQRAEYSKALLEYSIGQRKLASYPLAFGETSVKIRIKNILCYKKPAHGIVIMAASVCIAIAVCFLTDPQAAQQAVILKPTNADMVGVFDSYLYVDLQGKNYRYEQTGMDVKSVTKDRLLERFTEHADPANIDWEVYAVKEYPDQSVVLALAGADFQCLYRYSPSKRSDPDALQAAKDNGNVVTENGDVTCGQKIWQDFVQATRKGKPASVKISHYYTLDPESCSAQYYEVYKEDYPVIYGQELFYDGNHYMLRFKEGGEEYAKDYRYLMHYTDDAAGKNTSGHSFSRYVLTNDDTVTWEDLWKGMVSSQMSDAIDHYVILDKLQKISIEN